MKTLIGKLVLASAAAVIVASFVMAPIAEAQRRGGGGGAAAGARAGQGAQVNNSRADARTNDVRSTSVNNVNAERNVNVNVDCTGRCGGWDHPVAAAAVVGTTVAVTAAAVGSMVATVPPNCVPVNYGGMVYQQCGGTWYAPQGSQYTVVNPPY
ncbi:hypothetical protein [Paraburkholderia sp. BL10I2N1]|uniref:hypothetical protein n=1 Tax=Paraburkholderia sp. BL10I2N1 TaxID=1938796 RepID=UPI00105C2808|nr:hypothetical protein [Paraburkholderia sp. BL10I2N1]TDN67117.1 hypothetical protein B0G77_0350 [Paraburkholderia sp. BL10I2N1]